MYKMLIHFNVTTSILSHIRLHYYLKIGGEFTLFSTTQNPHINVILCVGIYFFSTGTIIIVTLYLFYFCKIRSFVVSHFVSYTTHWGSLRLWIAVIQAVVIQTLKFKCTLKLKTDTAYQKILLIFALQICYKSVKKSWTGKENM